MAADESATEAGVVVDGKTYAGAKQSDGRYKVTLPGIAAKDMDTEILYSLRPKTVPTSAKRL